MKTRKVCIKGMLRIKLTFRFLTALAKGAYNSQILNNFIQPIRVIKEKTFKAISSKRLTFDITFSPRDKLTLPNA